MSETFNLQSEYKPAGDQPKAISQLVDGLNQNRRNQVLLGVTGSGKTFTMANVIANTRKPALIMAPNKTLAAQLYSEMKEFFPNNAVEYFVSYYDYYQPEAYIAKSDTYIEKEATINDQLDIFRHSATRSLFERRDVVIVSSVSCIYGIGSPETYSSFVIKITEGMELNRNDFLSDLVKLQYERTEIEFERGSFRVRGNVIDVGPSHLSDCGWKIEMSGNKVVSIAEFDSLTNRKIKKLPRITIYGNSHYITPQPTLESATKNIKIELQNRVRELEREHKIVEAHRLKQKTDFDMEMIAETGSCKGIENYSRYLTGRPPGANPPTLFEYLPDDALLFIDESHVSVPQISGMYNGDQSRKSVLVEHGFRLPSALDNRPLKFEEWDRLRPQTIFVSATPGEYELKLTNYEHVEQIIRPTGLLDPVCEVRPAENQVDDLVEEIQKTVEKNNRTLVTTLTKKMAEKLSEHLCEIGTKVAYLHSEIHTLDRIEIIRRLRKGDIDVIIGINLLREGLDVPECALIAILDADKEGFLRSETSLIQTIGRAARNIDGKAVLYAEKVTKSMKFAIDETERRRKIQKDYNDEHGLTPKSVQKNVTESFDHTSRFKEDSAQYAVHMNKKQLETQIKKLKKQMRLHAKNLEFERATELRNEMHELEKILLEQD